MEREKERMYVTAKDVGAMIGVSRATAYQILAKLNAELGKKGYITVRGKVSRKYFLERTGNA